MRATARGGTIRRAEWIAARVETISYKQTRDDVARVQAFSTIYDWRLNGTALPLSDRIRGVQPKARKSFACPLAAAAPDGFAAGSVWVARLAPAPDPEPQ